MKTAITAATPLLLAAAALLAAPANAQGAALTERRETVEFTISGQSFSLRVPEGYCVPAGRAAEVAAKTAAGDSQNDTLVDLQRCGTFGEDYILIKTPRGLPPLNLPKETFIPLVAQQLGGTAVEEGKAIGAQDVDKMSEGRISVKDRDYGFAGTDEDCAYMAGGIQMTAEGKTVDVRIGSCITLVGTRNFAIHAYDNRKDGASADALRQRTRDIANAITIE
jgi:hypothetical protein